MDVYAVDLGGLLAGLEDSGELGDVAGCPDR